MGFQLAASCHVMIVGFIMVWLWRLQLMRQYDYYGLAVEITADEAI
jgi:hypothetical protein